jgi:hypothetical protein
LRTYSVKEAIAKVFREVRALRYQTDSPCRTCNVYGYCEKSPTAVRQQAQDPERAIRYYCDVAVDRAERATGRRLPHPLRSKGGT